MLNDTYWVEKSNTLNELRRNNMSLQELRFLTIYLAKINSRDIKTRNVEFKVEDFIKIMNINKVNIWSLKEVTDSLLCKIVHINSKNGGYSSFQLFKECNLYQNDYGDWIVQIDAHDKSLPLMFDFKGNYFKYQLWNSLALKSSNQLAIYEILKQYEKIGTRIITIADLKILLGISEKEYPIWSDFKKRVVDSCQKSLKEHTDIYFDYEPIKKGRKFVSIKFIIHKNKDFKDPLGLKEFIGEYLEYIDDYEDINQLPDNISFIIEATDGEFNTAEQGRMILDIVSNLDLDEGKYGLDITRFDFIRTKYIEFKLKQKEVENTPNKIKSPFKYFCSMLKQ